MIQIAGDLKFPGWSGLIQSLQNSTTLRASSSGNIIIGLPHALLPETDALQSLGSAFLRWDNIDVININSQSVNSLLPVDARAVSGNILSNDAFFHKIGTNSTPFESIAFGSGLQIRAISAPNTPDSEGLFEAHELKCSGHFTPGTITGGFGVVAFQLGLPTKQWAAINAHSGVFTQKLIAPLISAEGVDMQATSTIKPTITQTISLGSFSREWANIYAVSGHFTAATTMTLVTNERAELSTTSTLTTGSGYALRNENIWYDHLKANSEAIEITTLTMSMDNLATRPYGVPIADANSVVLADHFSIITSQGQTATKDDWYAYVRRTQSDGSVEATSGIVASGQIGWAQTGDTIQKTWGRWNTSGNVPVEFEPGSCYDVVIHNDGSGTFVNAPVARLSLGFRINANAVDLGRGE